MFEVINTILFSKHSYQCQFSNKGSLVTPPIITNLVKNRSLKTHSQNQFFDLRVGASLTSCFDWLYYQDFDLF